MRHKQTLIKYTYFLKNQPFYINVQIKRLESEKEKRSVHKQNGVYVHLVHVMKSDTKSDIIAKEITCT